MKILLHGVSSNWDKHSDPILTIRYSSSDLRDVLPDEVIKECSDESQYLFIRALDANKHSNRGRWDEIEVGDISVIHGDRRILFTGEVAYKCETAAFEGKVHLNHYDLLPKRSRMTDKRKNKRYPLLYILKGIQTINSSKAEFMSAIGYSQAFMGQGFRIINDEAKILRAQQALLEFRYPKSELSRDIEDILQRTDLKSTEKARMIETRCGQGQFRNNLLNKWQRQCSVTGCNLETVLIASHIKPWSKSDHAERLHPDNGLLLTPNLDKLFDRGFITFCEQGKIKISKCLPREGWQHLGIHEEMRLRQKSDVQEDFLKYHRSEVYIEEVA